mgnify:CR=1 FL=1
MIDADETGASAQDDVANYTNVVSNRLYGIHVGGGYDWLISDIPPGAFAVSLDTEGGMFLNFVKERAKYELGDESVAASRARNVYTFAPMVSAKLSVWWYPIEAIQVRVGWDLMMFFNTVASRHPVDFNYGALAPAWDWRPAWPAGHG